MNQKNRLRSARWVMNFGSIMEIDRSRPLPVNVVFKSSHGKIKRQKGKNRD